MDSTIVSVKRQTITSLSDKKIVNTALVFKSNADESNYQLTYRANTNYLIAFSVNENIETDFQVPYQLFF